MTDNKPVRASPITKPVDKDHTLDRDVPPSGKRTTLTFISGNRWDVEFEGPITRRDIFRLQRLLMIEFAKAERRRSAKKLVPLMNSANKEKS